MFRLSPFLKLASEHVACYRHAVIQIGTGQNVMKKAACVCVGALIELFLADGFGAL